MSEFKLQISLYVAAAFIHKAFPMHALLFCNLIVAKELMHHCSHAQFITVMIIKCDSCGIHVTSPAVTVEVRIVIA